MDSEEPPVFLPLAWGERKMCHAADEMTESQCPNRMYGIDALPPLSGLGGVCV